MIALLAALIQPVAPPSGTYTYRVAGYPAFTSTTVVVSTRNHELTVVEHPAIAGVNVVTEIDYDRSTLLPVRYAGSQNGRSIEVTVAGDTATLSEPKLVRTKILGTKGMMLSDGLAGYRMMMPSIFAAAGTPMTDLALNGFALVRIDTAAAGDVPPAGVPHTDVESAFTDSLGVRMTMWTNPVTRIVDHMEGGGLTFSLVSHTAETAAATPAPPAAQPSPYPTALPEFTSRDVSFPSADGATLAGTLTVPNGATKRLPVVILVHGSGPGTRDGGVPANPTFLDLSNALSNAGFIVLRYDKRGIGASTGTPTEDWRILVQDVRAAAAFARTQPQVDPNSIVLLGHSEGGLIVPLAAANVAGAGRYRLDGAGRDPNAAAHRRAVVANFTGDARRDKGGLGRVQRRRPGQGDREDPSADPGAPRRARHASAAERPAASRQCRPCITSVHHGRHLSGGRPSLLEAERIAAQRLFGIYRPSADRSARCASNRCVDGDAASLT